MTTSQEYMPITPEIVTWARGRAGYSLEEAEKTFKKIDQWEKGELFPTYPQLEQLSEKFKIPVAVFFFPEPPVLPDIDGTFRTLSQEDMKKIPPKIRLLLRKASAMQISLAELNDGTNPAQHLVTRDLKLDINQNIDSMAQQLRKYLSISIEEQFSWSLKESAPENALKNWRQVIIDHGIYVFKDAFKEPNYYGFSLHNEEFPIIYVNNSSADTRQIFTIFHELAHLLFHTSGIDVIKDDYINRLPGDNRRIEIICNRFAARFLVPEKSFEGELLGLPANRETAKVLADKFCVSKEVIYRKFLDRKLISSSEYSQAAEEWRRKWEKEKNAKQAPGGGNFFNSQIAYLGRSYVELAFERFYQNRFDTVQLAEYLNIKPKSVPGLEDSYLGVSTR